MHATYHSMSYHAIPYHSIPYYTMSYHTIIPNLSQGVWGPFYKIWKLFLQVAILAHWAPSFVDRFFRYIFTVILSYNRRLYNEFDPLKISSIEIYPKFWLFKLWIIHHNALKIIYLVNQYCIHNNGMASKKQRKQDLCALTVSHEHCKTLSIAKVGPLTKLLPKTSIHSSNRTCLRYAIKNFAFRISTCLPLSRRYCEVLAVPPLFLQESGHSGGIPVESGGMNFSRRPC